MGRGSITIGRTLREVSGGGKDLRVLITGATGFIGTHLVHALIVEGNPCRCLVRRSSDLSSLKELGVEIFSGDLADPKSLQGVAEDIDVVYHLAAEGHVSAVSDDASESFKKINVCGTENLAKECLDASIHRFIHFSSTAAMGLINKPRVDESTPCEPSTPYQISKFDSEQMILSFLREYSLPALVLRPCFVYGPGGGDEFLKLCRLIKKGLFPKIGKGRNLTPIVHVKDVVDAALLAAKKGAPGETYLIASQRSFQLEYIRKLIMDAMGIKRPYIYVPDSWARLGAGVIERIAEISVKTPIVTRKNIESIITDRELDISKAIRELGYMPSVGIESGIRETVEWYVRTGLL